MTSIKRIDPTKVAPRIVVIGSSTGGPRALEDLFSMFQKPMELQCPYLIAQHMPAGHTRDLAARLEKIAGVPAAEAMHQEELKNGRIYVAPGDFHLSVVRRSDGRMWACLDQRDRRNFVRPAADYLFESAADALGTLVLGVVLTGMGSDGRDGAVHVKSRGGNVLIQSKESCTVWGMPKAVFEADAYDEALDLQGLAGLLTRMTCRRIRVGNG